MAGGPRPSGRRNAWPWWTWNGGEIAWTFREERGPVWSLAFSPDGRRLAVGLSDGGLAVWNLDRFRALLDEVLPQTPPSETARR